MNNIKTALERAMTLISHNNPVSGLDNRALQILQAVHQHHLDGVLEFTCRCGQSYTVKTQNEQPL